MVGVDVTQLLACHWLMLRIAGIAPDDLMSQCRRWLGQRRALDVGRAVAFAVLSQRIRLRDSDVDLLAELLAADGGDTSILAMVEVADTDPMPMFGFAPTRARVDGDMGVAADTSPAGYVVEAQPEDDIDAAALSAVRSVGTARAIWRAWRYPGDGAPWPPPRRVWVVEANEEADLVGIALTLQKAVEHAGEVHPQVEVYPTGAHLPSYQRLARSFGGLMWASEPDPGIHIAGIFDVVDKDGPRMYAEHPVLSGPEADQVLRYLTGGEPILTTGAVLADVMDSNSTAHVPMNFVTDGFWVWCDASTYYVATYALAPDPRLLQHMRARNYQMAHIDGAASYRATARLQDPASTEKIWAYGE